MKIFSSAVAWRMCGERVETEYSATTTINENIHWLQQSSLNLLSIESRSFNARFTVAWHHNNSSQEASEALIVKAYSIYCLHWATKEKYSDMSRLTWAPKGFSDGYTKDPNLAAILLDSLCQRNISDFRYALEVMKCDPNLLDVSSGLSVFQTCLQTPNSVEFIKLCINSGANFYKVRGFFIRVFFSRKKKGLISKV